MGADEPLELTDQLRSCPEFKLGVDPRLECEQAPLLQPLGLLGAKDSDSRSASARPATDQVPHPAAPSPRRGHRGRSRASCSSITEPVGVEFARPDAEQIARWVTLDAIAAHEPRSRET